MRANYGFQPIWSAAKREVCDPQRRKGDAMSFDFGALERPWLAPRKLRGLPGDVALVPGDGKRSLLRRDKSFSLRS
jgi:hypothetical protein